MEDENMSEEPEKVVKTGDMASGNEGMSPTPQNFGHPTMPNVSPAEALAPDPKVEALNEAVRRLIDASTKLTVKVATCSCENAGNCGVFKFAKEVAKAIDELQALST